METVEITIDIAAPFHRVLHALWELESWPEITPHVRRIEMHFRDETVQVLTMHVATGQRLDSFKSVRILQPAAIFFFQPTPPTALLRHFGWWRLAAIGEATRVTSEHQIEIDPRAGAEFLAGAGVPAADDEEIRGALHRIIGKNSLQTMTALKERLESQRGGSHALPQPTRRTA
jgi:hypothetical protein